MAEVPSGAEWLYELKLDGYRVICIAQKGRVSLLTRRGNDWTGRFPTIARAVVELGVDNAIFNGEIVALKADGRSDFQALQNMLRQGDQSAIVFFVFDLLCYRGYDLRQVALSERKQFLSQLKSLAKAFADALVREQPNRYIAQSSKAKRVGKIYLDYLRNERGATAVASYSTHARPGASVATPLSWDELSASLQPDRFSVRTVPQRLRKMQQDPWHSFFELRQSISRDMRAQIEKW